MTSVLRIGAYADGRAFTLPADLGDKKFALLAVSKAGKTYGLGDVLEELTEAQRPWCAFDPANNLWGLRVLPDGSPSGLPIVVMGGDHGDLTLEKDAGERVAEAWLSEPSCLVVDVAFESKTTSRKFVADFCGRIMRTRSQVDRVVFFEEGPEFVPQSEPSAGIKVCKAAVDRVIRIGGNFGYGSWLASQRSATIDKDVLSQCEALVVMRLTDKRDRAAVRDWIVAKNIDDRVRECFDNLGSLKDGEAWLWWPTEDRFERFTFRKRRTLHPREMKRLGLKPTAVELGSAQAFVEKLRRQLTRIQAAVPVETKGPKARRAQGVPAVAGPSKFAADAAIGVSAALEGAQEALKEGSDRIAELSLENGKLRAEIANERARRQDAERRLAAVRERLKPEYDALRSVFEDLGSARPGAAGGVLADDSKLQLWMTKAPSEGIRKMLEYLRDHGEATMPQLCQIAGVAPRTGRNYVGWIKRMQIVEKDGNTFKLRTA